MTKPTLSPTVILAWLRERAGVVSEFQRLAEGEESQAFGFRHDGADFVVRVNRSAAGFRRDRYASERFASVDLPIPEVVTVERLDAEHAICVTRRLPGVTLQACDAGTVTRLAGALDATLATIASADIGDTSGFGPFNPAGDAAPSTPAPELGPPPWVGSIGAGVKGRKHVVHRAVGADRTVGGAHGAYPSWRAFLLTPRQRDWEPVRAHVDHAVIDRLLDELGRLVDACPEQRRLIHGDFGSNNVLTDGQRITGVLDWENALFGDPLYDAANVLFWAPWLECMRIQAAHYRATMPSVPDLAARLRCYQIHIALAELSASAGAGAGADGDDGFRRWIRDRSLKLLEHDC